ncbi:MAG TPA: HEXXH motif-containing putative peptide modification protein [Streptosporangiaceae bacterium]|nr:HEXXH motif-containing putative peptide modification protein [Streptosporangiaceae bacterium]
MWAVHCYARLRSLDFGKRADPFLTADLAPFATFAAVAALRAGHPFELRLPIRNGKVTLPGLGQARIGPLGHSGLARMRSDSNGVLISSSDGDMRLPPDFRAESSRNWPNWTPVPRVRIEGEGLTLDAIVDVSDPLLARLGPPLRRVKRSWQPRLPAAWSILARHHRPVATGLADILTTLVPLAELPSGRPHSATSGWAWGAIGLSSVDDEELLAETLLHEFQHLVLAAVEDLGPLVEPGTGELSYVGWRDDPRPAPAILHGTFAQFAVAGYWLRQRKAAGSADRFRHDVEFARARRSALAGVLTLDGSPLLTTTGRNMTGRVRDRLEVWQYEDVSGDAEAAAAELAAEHYLRWRIAHLKPDEQSIQALATQWLDLGVDADGRPAPRVDLTPGNRSPSSELAELLERRYRDPARLSKPSAGGPAITAVHLALANGDDAQACEGYLNLVMADANVDAWIGLTLARRRLSGLSWSFPISCRPEIAIAVHDRLRALSGGADRSEAFVEWLARNWLSTDLGP